MFFTLMRKKKGLIRSINSFHTKQLGMQGVCVLCVCIYHKHMPMIFTEWMVGSVIHPVNVFKFEIMCRFQKIQYRPTSYLIGKLKQGNYNSQYLTTGVRFTHSPSLRVSSSEGSSLKLPHSPHNLFFSIVSTSTSPYAAPSHVNYQYSHVIRLRNIYVKYHTHRKYSKAGTFTIFAK